MSKKQPIQEAVTFGRIPDELWEHEKWFIGKLQLPIAKAVMDQALIYDETRLWSLYIPVEWTKELDLKGRDKVFFWMWFNKATKAIQIEEGTKVDGEPYW